MHATLSPDGHLMIPPELLKRLKIKPGDTVDVRLDNDGRLIVQPVAAESRSRFAAARGTAPKGMSTDELMELLRGGDHGD